MNKSNFLSSLQGPLKYTPYLAGLLLVPGALIGAPLLWLANHYMAKSVPAPQKDERNMANPNCVHCG
jgi:hypothetical protein